MHSNLRVALAHYCEPGDISGVTTWIAAMARRLKADGIPVAVHLIHQPDDDPSLTPIHRALSAGGIELSTFPSGKSLRADLVQTLSFLNQWQPTVFLPNCKGTHYFSAATAGDQGLSWALTLHSDDPHYWGVVRSLPPADHGGHPVCVSRHIAQRYQALTGEDQLHIIPCGVAIPHQTTSFRSHPFRVAYSGRIWEHQKRASLVIDTLIRLCQRSPAIEAIVIGEGHALPLCRSRVEAMGLDHAIRFTGRLDPAAVQRVLSDCQAILLMSDFEGLPVALLEAMAIGVVPVARSIPSGIPELVEQENTGLLVSSDPDVAAEALLRLSADPELWKRCSRASREKVARHYNSDLCYSAWRTLLLDLHCQSTVRYPLKVPQSLPIRGLDPMFLAPYGSRPQVRRLLRQQWQTRMAQIKHLVRGVTRPG